MTLLCLKCWLEAHPNRSAVRAPGVDTRPEVVMCFRCGIRRGWYPVGRMAVRYEPEPLRLSRGEKVVLAVVILAPLIVALAIVWAHWRVL